MECARRKLASLGYTVLGGFLSPSHDLYVGPKMRHAKARAFTAAQRLELVELAVCDAPWLAASPWESTCVAGRWPDFPEVVSQLTAALRAHALLGPLLAAQRLTPFYVCGQDHFEKCGRFTLEAPAGVVVVTRAEEGSSSSSSSSSLPADSPSKLLFYAENASPDTASLSSTRLRAALAAGGDLGFAAAPRVAAALRRMQAEALPEPAAAAGWVCPACTLENSAEAEACAACEEDRVGAAAAGSASASAGGAGAGAGAAPSPSAPPRPRCTVFISLSALLQDLAAGHIPAGLLEADSTLLFFGSKRFWLWPASEAQRAESATQGRKYLDMAPELLALIAKKEAAGQVCFLKPDVLGEPDVAVFGEYARASAWLQAAAGAPLQLSAQWWEGAWRAGKGKYCTSARRIVDNYTQGLHGYAEVCELLFQSGCNPVLHWRDRLF